MDDQLWLIIIGAFTQILNLSHYLTHILFESLWLYVSEKVLTLKILWTGAIWHSSQAISFIHMTVLYQPLLLCNIYFYA